MAKASGGSGRGGGGGFGGLKPNATGGTVRQIAGQKYNTADVVNRAIAMGGKVDTDSARANLQRLGLREYSAEEAAKYQRFYGTPPPNMLTAAAIQKYAREDRILRNIDSIVHANVRGQIGKWDFTSAQSIHSSFDAYLSRRVSGQRARWTSGKRGR